MSQSNKELAAFAVLLVGMMIVIEAVKWNKRRKTPRAILPALVRSRWLNARIMLGYAVIFVVGNLLGGVSLGLCFTALDQGLKGDFAILTCLGIVIGAMAIVAVTHHLCMPAAYRTIAEHRELTTVVDRCCEIGLVINILVWTIAHLLVFVPLFLNR